MSTPYNPSNPTYPSPKEWVYSLLHQHGELTRKELVDKTQLADSTVRKCLHELLESDDIARAANPTKPNEWLYHVKIGT